MKLAQLAIATAFITLATSAVYHPAYAKSQEVGQTIGQRANDGWPVNIPGPGSAAPTTADWDAMNWEVLFG